VTANNPKIFWALNNQILGKNQRNELQLKINDAIITNYDELAERFQEFFIGKVTGLANQEKNP
jgi:hypothetical protein